MSNADARALAQFAMAGIEDPKAREALVSQSLSISEITKMINVHHDSFMGVQDQIEELKEIVASQAREIAQLKSEKQRIEAATVERFHLVEADITDLSDMARTRTVDHELRICKLEDPDIEGE